MDGIKIARTLLRVLVLVVLNLLEITGVASPMKHIKQEVGALSGGGEMIVTQMKLAFLYYANSI